MPRQYTDFDRLVELVSGAISCADDEDAIELIEEEERLVLELASCHGGLDKAVEKLRILLLRLKVDSGDFPEGELNIRLLKSALGDLRTVASPPSAPRLVAGSAAGP